jgi:ATP-dependent helicase/nuclease subunit B
VNIAIQQQFQSLVNGNGADDAHRAYGSHSAAHTIVLSPSDRARRGFERLWRSHALASRDAAIAPEFLTTDAWLAKLWSDAQCVGLLADERTLISETIETALWREAAQQTGDFTPAEASAVARALQEAWSLEHRYADGRADNTESNAPIASGANGVLYANARRWFVNRLREPGALTRAQLPACLAAQAGSIKALMSSRIVQTPSFAPIPAVDRALATLASAASCQLLPFVSTAISVSAQSVTRFEFALASDQRGAVVEAARLATLDAPLAIVVPELQLERGQWQRALTAAGVHHNLSLGPKLSEHPYVAALIRLLEAVTTPIDVEIIAQALRHPRWARSQEQMRRVSAREIELLNLGYQTTSLSAFEVGRETVFEPKRKQTRAAWAQTWRVFTDQLTIGHATMTSERFQLESAYQKLLATWTTLDQWLGALSASSALAEWSTLLSSTPFQPEGDDAPVQVMGLLESAGTPFSSVWITGLNDEVLPERSRQNPFLLAAWQRNERIGLGSLEECTSRAERLWHGWQSLSTRLTVSTSRAQDTRLVSPSPFVAGFDIQAMPRVVKTIKPPTRLSDERDAAWIQKRALSSSKLEAQALCPRRGWARIRLDLDDWPRRFDGVPPMVRGKIVHRIAETMGRSRMHANSIGVNLDFELTRLPNWTSSAISEFRELAKEVHSSVWDIEAARLYGLFNRFLQLENLREPFRVIDVECDIETDIDSTKFKLRIDRIESIGDDAIVILDFKSGQVNRKGLIDQRLSSPQLPLYALALERNAAQQASAISFAQLHDDEVTYVDVGRVPLLPKKKPTSNFDEIQAQWPVQISALIREVKEGDAIVAPIEGNKTCEYCGLQRLCRVDVRELTEPDDE